MKQLCRQQQQDLQAMEQQLQEEYNNKKESLQEQHRLQLEHVKLQHQDQVSHHQSHLSRPEWVQVMKCIQYSSILPVLISALLVGAELQACNTKALWNWAVLPRTNYLSSVSALIFKAA